MESSGADLTDHPSLTRTRSGERTAARPRLGDLPPGLAVSGGGGARAAVSDAGDPVEGSAAFGETQADRDGGGLDPTRNFQLPQDVPDVHADRLLADEEPLTDLAVRPAERDEAEHLSFATAQPERVRSTTGLGWIACNGSDDVRRLAGDVGAIRAVSSVDACRDAPFAPLPAIASETDGGRSAARRSSTSGRQRDPRPTGQLAQLAQEWLGSQADGQPDGLQQGFLRTGAAGPSNP